MDYVYLKEFLASYSLPTLVIALVVTVVSLVTDKLAGNKLPAAIKTYLPFILSILLTFFYQSYFVFREFSFHTDTFYAGLLSGSLSALANGLIGRIKRGEPLSVSATAVIIESIICGYVNEKILAKVALSIEKLYLEEETFDQEKVAEILKNHSAEDLSETQCMDIAKLIVEAVNAVRR